VVKEEHDNLEKQEQQQSLEITKLESKVDELREKMNQIDSLIDVAQEQLVEASAEVERWEGRKALMQEKRSNAEKQLNQLQLALKEAKEEEAALANSEEENKQQYEIKKKEIQKLKAEIKQLDMTINSSVTEIEQQIEEAK